MFRKKLLLSSKILIAAVWTSFFLMLGLTFFSATSPAANGLSVTPLSWTVALLVLFISAIIHSYLRRYLDGDNRHLSTFFFLTLLTLSILLGLVADHLLLLGSLLSLSHAILSRLMIHKQAWNAARASGILALKTLLFGNALFFLGALCLYQKSQTFSLFLLNASPASSSWGFLGLSCILLSALTQSALFPFHRYLTSSLNSPTPISAFMHAGLINGGGILIIRFAPLFIKTPFLLEILFLFGLVSALLGTAWKLIQGDIKRMLASSTLAQMGFMMMQCGMGLFAPALSHLFWHGIYKGHLFLRSGSAAADPTPKRAAPQGIIPFLLSCIGGGAALIGFLTFQSIAHPPSFLTLILVWMGGTQMIYSGLRQNTLLQELIKGLFIAMLGGVLYSLTILSIEKMLGQTALQHHLSSPIYVIGAVVLCAVWVVKNLHASFGRKSPSKLFKAFYVFLLNGAQPNTKTLTLTRHQYKV